MFFSKRGGSFWPSAKRSKTKNWAAEKCDQREGLRFNAEGTEESTRFAEGIPSGKWAETGDAFDNLLTTVFFKEVLLLAPMPITRTLLSRLFAFLAFIHTAFSLAAAEPPGASKAEHVVLIIWDGMRPDFINAENTPNLQALIQRGTYFANNHSVWPTTTEVNGTVLATGAFPAHSGVVANREFRPEIDPRGPVATEALETLRKGDELSGGKYLRVPTVVELARLAGESTAVAGTKPVALLQDRSTTRPAGPRSGDRLCREEFSDRVAGTDHGGAPDAFSSLQGRLQRPEAEYRWQPLDLTRALVEHLWHEEIPRYSVLWLSDPDFPQHVSAPGHPVALAGIHDSDSNHGAVIAELSKRGQLDKTDIFVVSDHGFSTIEHTVDSTKYFTDHGVAVSRQFNARRRPMAR